MKPSILIYESTFNILRKMPPDEFKKHMCILADYVMKDEPFPVVNDPAIQMFYDLTKPLLDANIKNYKNGKNGGRPRKNKTEQKPNNNPNETESKPNVHVHVQDKVEEHEHVHVQDNVEVHASSFGISLDGNAKEEEKPKTDDDWMDGVEESPQEVWDALFKDEE